VSRRVLGQAVHPVGVVRLTRRPPGWRAPGPPPAAPADRSELWPRPGEDLCHLAGDWRILQLVRGHRWSLDDLVTAWFAAEVVGATPPRRFADLGCGIGAVLLLLAWRFPEARGVGVEAQTISVDLARRSVAWNGVDGRCQVRRGDLRDAGSLPEGGVFDLVTATPPYLPLGTAHGSRRAQWAGCHLEQRGGIEEYCAAAARLLTPGGWFVTCAGNAQRDRVADGARRAGLSVVRRRDVIPRAGKGVLFSVHALRAGGAAVAEVANEPLVVRDATGRRTAAFHAVRGAMGMPP
jgi:tRNA1(Val) A37 N6-methylase TrmN6